MIGSELTTKIKQAEERYDDLRFHMYGYYDKEKPLRNSIPEYYYLKIDGAQYVVTEDMPEVFPLIRQLITGMFASNAPISFVICGDVDGVSVYYGTSEEHDRTLHGLLSGLLYCNGIDSRVKMYCDLPCSKEMAYHSFLKGYPVLPKDNTTSVIDSVIRGMRGKKWQVAVFAVPADGSETLSRASEWMNVYTECSALASPSVSGIEGGRQFSYSVSDQKVILFKDTAEHYCDYYYQAMSEGEWFVTTQYSAETISDGRLLGGLLVAAFGGGEQGHLIEPVHLVEPMTRGGYFSFKEFGTVTNMSPGGFPLYSTWLSSTDLSWFCSPPSRDTSGFYVRERIEFDVSRSSEGDLYIGKIQDAGIGIGSEYRVDLTELNRHCLVIGLTGSGKTNTVKSLLYYTHEAQPDMPFLIIEPAKREYYQIFDMGFDDLQVYSIGCAPGKGFNYCINPFERVSDEVSIQTHIDMVFSAFKASFIMYTPMPYVLEKAIYAIYEDMGWDVANNINLSGEDVYPTIEDLYFKLPVIIDKMGFDSRMRNDLTGSLQSRINTMRIGSKGQCLNVEKSFPIKDILTGNVVIELEDIGDDDVKAFIMSMLLVQLSEYRRGGAEMQKGLCHLLVMEEAHRLLKNVSSGTGENADPRGAAVEFFCNMLAEMRSKGQGFIVIDQIPSKLAPDLVKNTNLKIVHRVVDEEDRRLMGGAMNMTEKQTDCISSFEQGTAAVYSEGDYRPKMVRPPYAGKLCFEGNVSPSINRSRREILDSLRCFRIEEYPYFSCLTDVSWFCRHCPLLLRGKCSQMSSAESVIAYLSDAIEQVDNEYRSKIKEHKLNIDDLYSLMRRAVNKEEDFLRIRNCMLRHLLTVCWNVPVNSQNAVANQYVPYVSGKK